MLSNLLKTEAEKKGELAEKVVLKSIQKSFPAEAVIYNNVFVADPRSSMIPHEIDAIVVTDKSIVFVEVKNHKANYTVQQKGAWSTGYGKRKIWTANFLMVLEQKIKDLCPTINIDMNKFNIYTVVVLYGKESKQKITGRLNKNNMIYHASTPKESRNNMEHLYLTIKQEEDKLNYTSQFNWSSPVKDRLDKVLLTLDKKEIKQRNKMINVEKKNHIGGPSKWED